jgi:hypothetical protein
MRFESFEQFWPYYVREHSRKATRRLHFIGTGAAIAALAVGVLTRRGGLIALAPVLGYGPAWIGHFFVERNKPATFTYPLWSLMADFVMFAKMIDGTMDAEVERVMRHEETADSNGETEAHASEARQDPGSLN